MPKQEQMVVDPAAQNQLEQVKAATKELEMIEAMLLDAQARIPKLLGHVRKARELTTSKGAA